MTITDAAVEAAVRLSARYINDRFLPDKAIDAVDEGPPRRRLTVWEAKGIRGALQGGRSSRSKRRELEFDDP